MACSGSLLLGYVGRNCVAHRAMKLDHVVQVSRETEPLWLLSVAVGKGNGSKNSFMWLYVVPSI